MTLTYRKGKQAKLGLYTLYKGTFVIYRTHFKQALVTFMQKKYRIDATKALELMEKENKKTAEFGDFNKLLIYIK